MSRPTKQGLDYFPLDCQFDEKMELLIAEVGSDALAVVVTAWQLIYQNNGYYIENGKDLCLLIKRRIMIDLSAVENVINLAIERNIFDKTIENDHKILTSKAIQKRYFSAGFRKKIINVYPEYLLTEVNVYKNIQLTDLSGVNVDENPIKESKVKESKVIKEKEEPATSEKIEKPKKELPQIEIINAIPDDYKPEETFVHQMRLAGITKTTIEEQTPFFIIHHQINKTVHDNWDLLFKKWLMKGKANGWHKQGDSNNAAHQHNDKKSAGDIAREKIQQAIDDADLNR